MRGKALAAIGLLALIAQAASAQTAVGHNKYTVPANSDRIVCLPFTQAPVGTYAVSGKTATDLQVATTPWTAGALAAQYYVRFLDGNASGLWLTITTNATNSLTLDNSLGTQTPVLNLVTTGSHFRVYPHHTLGSVFPQRLFGYSFNASTRVLIYKNNFALGYNRSATTVASASSDGNSWTGVGVTNDTVIPPDTMFIVRNSSATDLTVIHYGQVPDYPVAVLAGPSGDLAIGTGYPVGVSLNAAGLERTDRRVLFSPDTGTGYNRSPNLTATYGSTWTGVGIDGTNPLKGSVAFKLRLPSTEVLWTKVTIRMPY
jgi:uncharacterized protein (TIGR02597 family)